MRNRYRTNQRWRRICPALITIHSTLRYLRAMRRVALFLLLIAVQATALAGISIEVPATPVAAGQNVQIYIEGIEPDLLSKAITTHWPREGTTFVPAKTWGGNPFIWFEATQPGRYLVSVTVPQIVDGEASLEHAEAVIVVGDGEPKPNPTPPPVPPVPVPGELSVLIWYESKTRTPEEALSLSKLRTYASTQKYVFRFEDKDLVDGRTRKVPAWLAPYLTALNTSRVEVPAILVGSTRDGDFSVVAVEPLPMDGDAAIALVKKYGG